MRRRAILDLVEHPWFGHFFLACIIANTGVLAAYHAGEAPTKATGPCDPRQQDLAAAPTPMPAGTAAYMAAASLTSHPSRKTGSLCGPFLPLNLFCCPKQECRSGSRPV
jgi:hypothetical protein